MSAFRGITFVVYSIIFSVIVFAALALSAGVATAETRPFKASITANASLSPTEVPGLMRNDETGGGNATHLGLFDWVGVEYANFLQIPGSVVVDGSFTMTAANGDKLYGKYATIAVFDAAGNLVIDGRYVITGGSGRFDDAQGAGDLNAIGYLAPGMPVIGTLDGTIDY